MVHHAYSQVLKNIFKKHDWTHLDSMLVWERNIKLLRLQPYGLNCI